MTETGQKLEQCEKGHEFITFTGEQEVRGSTVFGKDVTCVCQRKFKLLPLKKDGTVYLPEHHKDGWKPQSRPVPTMTIVGQPIEEYPVTDQPNQMSDLGQQILEETQALLETQTETVKPKRIRSRKTVAAAAND